MMHLFHNWRDVYSRDGLTFQECRHCLYRRRYMAGHGAIDSGWSDADLAELQERDNRAVLRVVLTNEGRPSGMLILKNGRFTAEQFENLRKGFDGWKLNDGMAIALEEDNTIRYEFVTVDQLTDQA